MSANIKARRRKCSVFVFCHTPKVWISSCDRLLAIDTCMLGSTMTNAGFTLQARIKKNSPSTILPY